MGELINLVKEYQRTHDPVVGDEIVRRISPGLRLRIRLHAPLEMVDDLLQETLIAVMVRIDHFKADTDAQFHGYCYTITRNKIADAFRRQGREPEFQFQGEEFWRAIAETKPALTEAELEQLREIMDFLAEVRPPCLIYLTAHYIAGLTFDEMREEFGFPSEDAARVATRRCLLLARELAED